MPSPRSARARTPLLAALLALTACGSIGSPGTPAPPATATAPSGPALTFPVTIHAPTMLTVALTEAGHSSGPETETVVTSPTSIVIKRNSAHGLVTTSYAVGTTGIVETGYAYTAAFGTSTTACTYSGDPTWWNRSVSVGSSMTSEEQCSNTESGHHFTDDYKETITVTGSAFVTVGGRKVATVVTSSVGVDTFPGKPTITYRITGYRDPVSGLYVREDETEQPSGNSNQLTADTVPGA